MKFAHLADLHIGKKLNGISLIEDQKIILNQVVDYFIENRVDGLLLAGDIYQNAQPSNEALMVFDTFLSQLVQLKIPVYMISGNHDSEERIAYFSKLICNANVFTNTLFDGKTQVFTLEDEYGMLDVHLLPFIKPVDVRHYYQDQIIDSYETMMSVVLKHSNMNPNRRNVLVCHQFITGAKTSDSEVFSIGMLDNISHEVFNDFDYVALGHLHHPQHVGRKEIRYSGSLLKYSLSEISSEKSMTIIEIKEKGEVDIHKVPFRPHREMREIRGFYKDLITQPYSEDFISVQLLDESVVPDAYLSLMSIFPNMISYRLKQKEQLIDHQEVLDMENKSVMDLFVDFYKGQNNDQSPSKQQLELIATLLQEIEQEDDYEAA